MNMMESINTFVDTMKAEEQRFAELQNQISRTEGNIKTIIEEFGTTQQSYIQSVQDGSLCKHDDAAKSIMEDTTKNLSMTIAGVENDITSGMEGIEFIEEFEKRFTVAVFGKVKAGKSYLGNFIKGNPVKKSGKESSYDKLGNIGVTVYDRGNVTTQTNLSTEDEFGVSAREATSTIQYFNMGAMTWFDTPGIGSVTWENELLAQEYVKNADLVIYACNSDAAGTQQDFEELKALHEMGKPVLLLLTQSDTTDWDDEEGEITVPKSPKDRRDVENYMNETICELGLKDLLKHSELLSISAYLGVQAITYNDEQLFLDSNMHLVLEKLVKITKKDAADMKRKTPAGRINAMIDDINKKLSLVEPSINRYFDKLEESKQELKGKKQAVIEFVRSDVNLKVSTEIHSLKRKVEAEGGSISGAELTAKVREIVSTSVQTICTNEIATQVDALSKISVTVGEIGDLKMKQDKIEYKVQRREEKVRDPRNFFEKAGEFLFDKTYYSVSTVSVTKYNTFDLGVNTAEVLRDIMRNLESVFERDVNRYFEHIFTVYYKPIEDVQDKLISGTKDTIRRLEKEKLPC